MRRSNFTTLFLMREKGMTLERGRDLLRAADRRLGLRRACTPPAGSSIGSRRAPRRAYAYLPAVGAGARHSVLHRLRLGARLAAGAGCSSPCPMFFNYFYLSPAVALVQEEVQPHERVLAGALLLLVMNLIGLGLGPDLPRRRQRLLPAEPSAAIRCSWLSIRWCLSTCWPCWASCGWRVRSEAREASAEKLT